MATFSKLLQTTGGTLARMQEEMRAIAHEDALVRAAEAKYGHLQEPVQMYHGSPYKFDEFDFDNFIGKGEGAQSFGPGGYMTGDEGLGREYARSLYGRHAQSSTYPHREAARAASIDPRAAAEYMRATTIADIRRGAIAPSWARYPDIPLDQTHRALMAHSWRFPLHRQSNTREFVPPKLIDFKSVGLQDYYDAMKARADVNIFSLPSRIGQGGASVDDVLRTGAKMAPITEDLLTPRIFQRQVPLTELNIPPNLREMLDNKGYSWDQGKQFDWQDMNALRQANEGRGLVNEPGMGRGYTGVNPKRQANLNAIDRFVKGLPGHAKVVRSMGRNPYVDLRNPQVSDARDFERRLYQTLGPSFSEMLSHDYPLSVNTPEVVGALSRLAQQRRVQLTPNLSGKDALDALKLYRGPLVADRKAALRDAGLKAMYFERGGKRTGKPPDTPNPSDYNYVIFDDDALAPPTWEAFRQGGVA